MIDFGKPCSGRLSVEPVARGLRPTYHCVHRRPPQCVLKIRVVSGQVLPSHVTTKRRLCRRADRAELCRRLWRSVRGGAGGTRTYRPTTGAAFAPRAVFCADDLAKRVGAPLLADIVLVRALDRKTGLSVTAQRPGRSVLQRTFRDWGGGAGAGGSCASPPMRRRDIPAGSEPWPACRGRAGLDVLRILSKIGSDDGPRGW